MKLFWKWMEKKGYADLRDYINNEYYIINKNKNSGVALKPEKQMLIGYMMEYILYKNNQAEWIYTGKNIDDVYDILIKEVKNINENT